MLEEILSLKFIKQKHTQNQDRNYCLSRGSRLANPIPIRGGTAGMYMQPNLTSILN